MVEKTAYEVHATAWFIVVVLADLAVRQHESQSDQEISLKGVKYCHGMSATAIIISS